MFWDFFFHNSYWEYCSTGNNVTDVYHVLSFTYFWCETTTNICKYSYALMDSVRFYLLADLSHFKTLDSVSNQINL